MKKVLTLLLALIMIIGVVACAPQEKKEEAPAKEATKEEKKEEKKEEPAKTEAASEEKKEEAPAEESKEEKKDEETKAEAAPAEGGDVVKLGVFEPFTGASASGGELTFEGIELALEEVPEVLGKKIELVKVDNKSEQVEASNAAQRLVDKDKVNAVIGSYGSSLSIAGGTAFKDGKSRLWAAPRPTRP